jgi:quinol monooxygenase YgiN
MAIGVLFDMPGVTRAQYEELNEQMFGTTQPDEPPEGLIIHTAGAIPGGWRVFDAWESRDAFDRFIQEQVMPAAEALGMPPMGEPQVYELHNMLMAQKSAA